MMRVSDRPATASWIPRSNAVSAVNARPRAGHPSWIAPEMPPRHNARRPNDSTYQPPPAQGRGERQPERQARQPEKLPPAMTRDERGASDDRNASMARARSVAPRAAVPPLADLHPDDHPALAAIPRPSPVPGDVLAVEGVALRDENAALCEENLTLRQQTAALRDELADLHDENDRLSQRLDEVVRSMETLRARMLAASEPELVRLAVAVAERVVGHELRTDPDTVVGWAREAVETLATLEGLTVTVSPDVASQVSPSQWERGLAAPHTVSVDASLPEGSCAVRAGASAVRTGAADRLGAVRESLAEVDG